MRVKVVQAGRRRERDDDRAPHGETVVVEPAALTSVAATIDMTTIMPTTLVAATHTPARPTVVSDAERASARVELRLSARKSIVLTAS